MRVFLLMAICAASMLCASFASDQALVPSKPVAELGYSVSPDFFDFPANWVEGEASGRIHGSPHLSTRQYARIVRG